MNLILLALLLQSSLVLPPRTALENPASVSPVPQKQRKDYEKLWSRFVASKDDAKLLKDLEKESKKQKALDQLWVIQGYLHLYRGDNTAAREKFTEAVRINSNNRIGLYYLAELAYAHKDYGRAATLYAQLQSVDPSHPDVETKRQRAFLLATDKLLQTAVRAESENRLAEAEGLYRQALKLAPNEPSLQARLVDLLLKQNRKEEAEELRKLAGVVDAHPVPATAADEPRNDDLADLGRWGGDIEAFHLIRGTDAVTREQFATLIVRYFPQVTEFRRTPKIVTDIQNSPARSEIMTVVSVGLMDPFPNHDFEPALPISRGDLAIALARLSRSLGLSGKESSIAPPDVAASNAIYPEIQMVLSYSIMTLENSGSFNVAGHVAGREAVQSAEQLLDIFQQAQR